MSLEDDAKILEVPAHPCTERLRIGRLAESRRADKVAEENRDDLALLAGRLGAHELGAARHTKAGLGRVLDTTAQTDRHGRSLRGQRPEPNAVSRRQPQGTFPNTGANTNAARLGRNANEIRPGINP